MKHQLPMREKDALGQPCGSGGVECRGFCVFIHVREIVGCRSRCQYLFVFCMNFKLCVRFCAILGEQNHCPGRGQFLSYAFQYGEKIRVDHNDLCFRMIEGVADLIC